MTDIRKAYSHSCLATLREMHSADEEPVSRFREDIRNQDGASYAADGETGNVGDAFACQFTAQGRRQGLKSQLLPSPLQRKKFLTELRQASSSGRAVSAPPTTAKRRGLAAVVLLAIVLACTPNGTLRNLPDFWSGGSGTSWSARRSTPEALLENLCTGCSRVPVMEDFDMARFMGQWHQVAWLPGAGSEPSATGSMAHCMAANFTGNSSKSFKVTFTSMSVHVPGQDSSSSRASHGKVAYQQGMGRAADMRSPAKLQIYLDSGLAQPLWVVSTNYKDWALLYSCSLQLGGWQNDQVFLLMGRKQRLDPMDVGDRLNQLAEMRLPWKHVAFAPVHECSDLLF
ncbi:hypothetical protein WJX72_011749 [[Myrmecia] bisecta]|uniref:Uncharacterized protein n=1 Tax=[Myrmecia] bisecta TaxID=41462 RepID=A0AAW1QT45_9CHLO